VRVAAIDIGTNSVLLLVADVSAQAVRPLVQRAVVTRLGQGVDQSSSLQEQAVSRTLEALRRFATEIASAGVVRTAAVATSALRDASSSADFLSRAQAVLGVAPRIISGAEEAQLTFDGALLGLGISRADIGMFDVGGGSTEVMTGRADENGAGRLEQAVSIDVGCVRLTERLCTHDPPTSDELDAIRRFVQRQLQSAPSLAGRPLIGVAGTVTTLAAVIGDVYPYDGDRIHGSQLTRTALHHALTRLAAMPLAARRQIPALEPGRADVIVAGAAVVDELLEWAGAERLVVSDRGIRWGLARRLATSASGH
jgi:exopolyphosphatase/guanosine-5'-triphosphate,3'-diphosphate pyrophosphatase